MAIFTIYLFTLLTTVSAHALPDSNLAIEIQTLNARAAAAGGWALITPTCPTTAKTCENFCCPFELECVRNGNGNHCCPAGTNCLAAYQSSPQCADDSWSLWKAKNDATHGFFCCLPGQIGTNAGTCVTANTPVVSSLSASLIAAATGTAAPAPASSSSAKFSTSTAITTASLASKITASVSSDASTATASVSIGTQSSASSTPQQTVKAGAGARSASFLAPLTYFGVLAVVVAAAF